MARQLDETILDGGIRNTHFFNGRWLTAEDLRTDQEANREQHRQLGRAIGEGVVHGLEVALADAGTGGRVPRVTVSAGLALNRRGEALALVRDVDLALTQRQEDIPPEAGLFAPCAGPSGDLVLTGAGVYVLAACPASGFRERAPGRELGDERSLAGCGSRYAVEGVRFRMVRLPLGPGSGVDDRIRADIDGLMERQDEPGRSLLRNHLAHLCLGTAGIAALEMDPFGALGPAIGIAALRGVAGLTDGDVLLALLVWTAQGVRIVDPWAVRRHAHVEGVGPAYVRFDPRLAAGRARLHQFHDHLRFLLQRLPSPSNVRVEEVFRYLPPAGLVPLTSPRFARGFSAVRFFESFAAEGARTIRSGQVAALLQESLLHPAIDLEQADFVQIYEVRESQNAQSRSEPPQPFLVFASRILRYIGSQPRYPHLCRTLTETRDAYRGLLTKRVFDTAEEPDWFFDLPVANVSATSSSARASRALAFPDLGDVQVTNAFLSSPAIAASALVGTARDASYLTAAILDVMATAGSWAAAACSALTEAEKALEALRQVYRAQRELVTVFEGQDQGSKPRDFAQQLLVYLDGSITATQPALKTALDQENPGAALGAQDAINQFVSLWSGDVTVGNLRVLYQRSSRGRTMLVPTAENPNPGPYEYVFEVANLTNRELDVQLAAEFLPPRQTWTPAVRAYDPAGVEISFVRLRAGREDPDGSETSQEVHLSLFTPPGAALGQTGTLRLRAFVPSPVSVAAQDVVALSVGDLEVPEEETNVRFTGPPGASSPLNQARVDNPIVLTFEAVFHAAAAPATRSFRFRLVATSTSTAGFYVLDFPSGPLSLQSDVPQPITAQVVPQAGAVGHPLTFNAVIESVDGSVASLTSGPFEVTTVA